MHVRFPEGFQSTVDAHLALTGPVAAPTLSGAVDVITTEYMREVDTTVTLASFGAASGLAGGSVAPPPAAASTPTGYPMKYDIQVNMPTPVPFISRKDARVIGHGDFLITGTLDKPNVTGRVDLDGGEIFFSGNRYQITPTSSIDFTNPTKFVPYFDVGLVTHARGAGQTYDIELHVTGTLDRFNFTATSQPWLSEPDVVTLLMGERQSTTAAETRALHTPQEQQVALLRTVLSQILASSISSRVSSVFERALQLDTVQITPFLGSEATIQNPDARLTVVRRISSRAFVTYSRALNQAYEVILLEYDQNDRVSWVLSRNEDRSFALDIRLRHVY
jgi:autotransporter translocation and assembly factor TamB